MIARLCVVVCVLALASGADDKWIWGSNSGRDGLRGEHSVARPQTTPLFQASASSTKKNNLQAPQRDEPSGSLRYEVFENGNGEGPNNLPSRPPLRPPNQYQGRPNPPFPTRPIIGGNPPPPPPLPPRPPPPPFDGRPPRPPPPSGNPDLGVLTGPVPSWERPPPPKNNDPTNFDTCKCVNSFNCKSPGLKFGSCDVGKQYCCYNKPGFGLSAGPGDFGNKEAGPGVLAGPGGPIDKYKPDFNRPDFNRPDFNRPDFNRPDFNRPLGPPPFPDEPFPNGPPPPGGPFPFDDVIVPRNSNARSGQSNKAKIK